MFFSSLFFLWVCVLFRHYSRVVCSSGLRERFLNLGKILFGKTAEMCVRSLNMGLLTNACVMY